MGKNKRNIVVLAGGESGERDVSLDSAKAIAKALRDSGNAVVVVDAFNGKKFDDGFIDSSDHATSEKYSLPDKAAFDPTALVRTLMEMKAEGIDVVFNGLHGGAGENGAMSALLESVGLPYTGSPMAASAIAMNKDIAKRVMWSLNIPTGKWRLFNKGERDEAETCIIIKHEFNLPVIIKPADCGSTVGLSLVESVEEIAPALQSAFSASDLVMAETYFQGREITVAVLDGTALPPVEIKPTHKLYDYTCKYTKGKSQYFCPVDIDEKIKEKLSDDAVRLYKQIGCQGYARVDFIVSDIDHYVCLELNTLPGMTELSLFPMAARAVGLDFAKLLNKLCDLALERKG
ncbi:MAG: D-alanine--D-alanine ligase [Candidatus Zixiibacteriota bacterium]